MKAYNFTRLFKNIISHVRYVIGEEIEDERKRYKYEKERDKRDPDRFVEQINIAITLRSARALDISELWISKYDMKAFGLTEDKPSFEYVSHYGYTRIYGSDLIPRRLFSWEKPE